MLDTIALVVIALLLAGILTAVKAGFNEVIKGLEAISDSQAGKARPGA